MAQQSSSGSPSQDQSGPDALGQDDPAGAQAPTGTNDPQGGMQSGAQGAGGAQYAPLNANQPPQPNQPVNPPGQPLNQVARQWSSGAIPPSAVPPSNAPIRSFGGGSPGPVPPPSHSPPFSPSLPPLPPPSPSNPGASGSAPPRANAKLQTGPQPAVGRPAQLQPAPGLAMTPAANPAANPAQPRTAPPPQPALATRPKASSASPDELGDLVRGAAIRIRSFFAQGDDSTRRPAPGATQLPRRQPQQSQQSQQPMYSPAPPPSQQPGAAQAQYQQPIPAARRSWRDSRTWHPPSGAGPREPTPRREQFEAIVMIFILGAIIALSPVIYFLYLVLSVSLPDKEHLSPLMDTLFTVSVVAALLYVLAMLALTVVFSAIGSDGSRTVKPVQAPKPGKASKASNPKRSAKTGANAAANSVTYGATGVGANGGPVNMGANAEPPARPARPAGDEQTLPYTGPIAGAYGSDAADYGRPRDEPQVARPAAPFVPAPPVPVIITRDVDENEQIEWRDPEPFDKRERDEHPHFHAEWETFGPWSIAAVSSRGIAHRKGKFRDDDFAIRLFRQRTPPPAQSRISKALHRAMPAQSDDAPYAALIAIADGLGSREYSRRGARAATEGATSISEDLVRSLCTTLERGAPLEQLHAQGRETLRVAFDAAARAVMQRGKDDHLSVDLLHSTLIIILAIPHPEKADEMILITSQVGDGALYTVDWTLQAPHERWNWLLKPQVESTGTQVTPFMTRYEREPERLLTEMAPIQPEPLTCLLAMTDGAADSLIPYDPGAAGGDYAYIQPFYADVRAVLRATAQQPQAPNRAVAFRRKMVEIFNTKLGSDDDITLVCLFHNRLLDMAEADS